MPVGKLNKEKAAAKAAQERQEQGGNTFYKPSKGKNRVRILPPPPGGEDVYYRTATHWGVGPNKDTFNCPAAQDKNADCYLCEVVHALSKGDDDDKGLADKLRAKKAWLYNIVDIKDVESGIQVASFGATIHNDIRDYIEDEDGDYNDITDLEEGYDIIIKATGEGKKRKYKVEAAKNPSPVPDEILEILEKENPTDLSTVRPIASNAKQKAAYEGDTDDDDDDEEEEEDDEPTVRKSRKADKKSKPEPEEDDDDDDEEEEVAPKKATTKKAKPASKPEPEEDEDDDDDEEDEEDDDEEEVAKKGAIGSALKRKRAGR